ncbi:hypothetical protein SY88_04135 [Clostridiales bacterium PH28_bin88]|nr:hypothetical protein SY88_04135 [Clostridiales bacterium PH28_bin88]
MWNVLNNRTVAILAKAMDAASLRQQVIANNIANANTPGFKRSTVVFEDLLRTALEEQRGRKANGLPSLGPDRLNEVQPRVVRDSSTTMRTDGNNVDIEMEMAQLAMNTINYNSAAQLLNGKLAQIRYVINEGRR